MPQREYFGLWMPILPNIKPDFGILVYPVDTGCA
jgi:hypothetical protein